MESVTTSPALDPAASTMPAVDADPFGGMFDELGTAEPAAAASSNSIVDLASSALGQIVSATPGMEADVAAAMTSLLDEISTQLSQVDLSDPASVEALSTSLTEMMDIAMSAGADVALEGPLIIGLADTALQALNMAVSDPVMGETAISDVMMSYSDFAADYEDVVAGVTELPVASEATFTTLVSLSQSLTAEGGAAAVDGGMASGTGEEMIDDAGMADGTETTEIADTGEAVDNTGGLSTEADPADLNASESNQEALEARFIALYERLMEKQVSFKERVEPFKTDNQNAGKG